MICERGSVRPARRCSGQMRGVGMAYNGIISRRPRTEGRDGGVSPLQPGLRLRAARARRGLAQASRRGRAGALGGGPGLPPQPPRDGAAAAGGAAARARAHRGGHRGPASAALRRAAAADAGAAGQGGRGRQAPDRRDGARLPDRPARGHRGRGPRSGPGRSGGPARPDGGHAVDGAGAAGALSRLCAGARRALAHPAPPLRLCGARGAHGPRRADRRDRLPARGGAVAGPAASAPAGGGAGGRRAPHGLGRARADRRPRAGARWISRSCSRPSIAA